MKNLSKALRAVGLTQAQAAELLGIHRTTVADKARGDVQHIGDLVFLIAAWGALDETQRQAVRRRIEELRQP